MAGNFLLVSLVKEDSWLLLCLDIPREWAGGGGGGEWEGEEGERGEGEGHDCIDVRIS